MDPEHGADRELTPEEAGALGADLGERFARALLPPARAGVGMSAEAVRARIDEPLPETGMPAGDLLAELEDRVGPALAGTTGGRYFGYVTGALLPGAALAQAWAAGVDQNLAMWAMSPAGAELEWVALRWIAELLEFPWGSGVFTTGATMANTVGLAVARHAFGLRHGVDVATHGVGALPPYAVYGSEELHLSDLKALRTLGLGSGCVRQIPIDERYAMRTDLLREAVEEDLEAGVAPFAVIAQAGSVNTGATDPLAAVADLCERYGAWLHVDGAFGAFFRRSPRTRHLVEGLERADSLAVDGHKWLNLPQGTGWALLHDPELHHAAFAGTAGYLTTPAGAGADLHEFGIESSRSWRGASAWAAVKQLGRQGVEELVTRCCELTAELVSLVEASPRLEMAAPAPSNVACFRYRPEGWDDGPDLDELNRAVVQEVVRGEDVFTTGASLAVGSCVRAAIVSWRTRSQDVRALVRAVEAAGGRLSRG